MIQQNDFNGAAIGKEPDYEAKGRCLHLSELMFSERKNRQFLSIKISNIVSDYSSDKFTAIDTPKLHALVDEIYQSDRKMAELIFDYNLYAERAGKDRI
jgi:hypothetical protein